MSVGEPFPRVMERGNTGHRRRRFLNRQVRRIHPKWRPVRQFFPNMECRNANIITIRIAGRMAQAIPNRKRSLWFDGLLNSRRAIQYSGRSKLRDVFANRIIQQKRPTLVQDHRDDASDRLCHRVHPDHGVKVERKLFPDVPIARAVAIRHLSINHHQLRGAGGALGCNIGIKRGSKPSAKKERNGWKVIVAHGVPTSFLTTRSVIS